LPSWTKWVSTTESRSSWIAAIWIRWLILVPDPRAVRIFRLSSHQYRSSRYQEPISAIHPRTQVAPGANRSPSYRRVTEQYALVTSRKRWLILRTLAKEVFADVGIPGQRIQRISPDWP
jgi:hypothetical protein